MKKVLAILLCFALMTVIFAASSGALTEEEANAGYYLVGSMTDWSIDCAYRLDLNPADSSEYLFCSLPLKASDEFKVVYTHNGMTIDEYFPAGFGNNCSLAAQSIYTDGIVDLYFRPNMDGQDDWYFGCIYLELKKVKPTESTVSTDATENSGEPDGGYYIVFKSDQNRIRERNRMNRAGADSYELHNLTLSTATPFKVAYSLDVQTASALYPAGEDEYYIPRYNSAYYTVIFTPEGNNGGDSSDMGWYDGYVQAYPCEPPWEDATEVVPVTNKKMKVNRYENVFHAAYPDCTENYCSYNELYYHKNMFDCDDWTLVHTPVNEPLDGGSYGVFDDLAVFAPESYPFTLGFGVFDINYHIFYSIDEAWDMGFDDLHDVFAQIAPQYADTCILGDADGDHELSILDVTLIQRCLANIGDLPNDKWIFYGTTHVFGPVMTYLTDYDCDGDRAILDATLIQRQLVGIAKYPHSFTASVRLEKDGDTVSAVASSAFGNDTVQYKFTIEGGVHAGTVYGGDWGSFNSYDEDYEPVPGSEHMTTGWIADNSVELPLKGITYNDDYTLTVTAKDASGKVSQPAVLYFKNVY